MRNLVFDEVALEMQLSRLSDDGVFAFGILCCERMFPNYVAFTKQHNWGDANLLRQTLDDCWDCLVTGRKKLGAPGIRRKCEEAAPDTEEFESVLVSPALDAALSVASLVEMSESHNVKCALTIATFARDTVDMFVQDLENMDANHPGIEECIRTHSMMQRELDRQQIDIDLLFSEYEIAALRDQFRNSATSNIAT